MTRDVLVALAFACGSLSGCVTGPEKEEWVCVQTEEDKIMCYYTVWRGGAW